MGTVGGIVVQSKGNYFVYYCGSILTVQAKLKEKKVVFFSSTQLLQFILKTYIYNLFSRLVLTRGITCK